MTKTALSEHGSHWQAVGVSVPQAGKQVCQDAYVFEYLGVGAIAIAVSDGAGSAARSEVGSTIACNAAVDYLRTNWTEATVPTGERLENLVGESVKKARSEVEAEAKRLNVPLRDLSATLVVVLADGERAAAAQVGDCMAIAETETGDIVALTMPERGEYANETTMLTSADALTTMQVFVTPGPVLRIAAMTDGFLPVSTIPPYYRPSERTFRGLFTFAANWENCEEAHAQVASFIRSDRVQQGTGDDLTLVLARKR